MKYNIVERTKCITAQKKKQNSIKYFLKLIGTKKSQHRETQLFSYILTVVDVVRNILHS